MLAGAARRLYARCCGQVRLLVAEAFGRHDGSVSHAGRIFRRHLLLFIARGFLVPGGRSISGERPAAFNESRLDRRMSPARIL
jgi:hypothetical protein